VVDGRRRVEGMAWVVEGALVDEGGILEGRGG